jgi:hypothetical protein
MRKSISNNKSISLTTISDVYINGIVIGTTQTRKEFPLKFPLDYKHLFNWIDRDDELTFVRINILIGDFLYEPFNIKELKSSNRIGVISHLQLTDLICSLFDATFTHYLIPVVLKSELIDKLASYPPLERN